MTEEKEKELCGLPCEVYSRVVGYLRPVQQWNKGKKEEFIKRREFINKEKENDRIPEEIH